VLSSDWPHFLITVSRSFDRNVYWQYSNILSNSVLFLESQYSSSKSFAWLILLTLAKFAIASFSLVSKTVLEYLGGSASIISVLMVLTVYYTRP